ncbi:MAG: formylglycine-generating enzyme family protein [Prosthecobacter sp.]|uniref:formylglycine-generating enzyme family protein n=1 Tax=Prosthecobacter sp. TaxID=1965333 RepID=UPI00390222F7
MIRQLLPAVLFVALLNTVHAASPPELMALQQQYEFLVAERVTTPYDMGMEALNAKFLMALTSAGDEAKKAGKLPEALAIEEDKKLISSKQPLPEKDDETTPASLKKLHAVYRLESAKLAQQRTAAHAALLPAYTAKLKELESTLTKGDRLAEAKEVMQYREGQGTAVTPLVVGKEFTNSLGMKFVPVRGTDVLFCIHETRRQDYAKFSNEVPNVKGDWKTQQADGIPVSDKDDHPVVSVGYEDARAFCVWLSRKEGNTYRLPTDKEWSIAAGIESKERWTKDSTPESLNGKLENEFPWGSNFPPKTKDRAGNYADTAWKEKFPKETFVDGYTDGFPTSAPVMSFKPNKHGLYDMGGNVWECVEDWWNAAKIDRAIRGSSWRGRGSRDLQSSNRVLTKPDGRLFDDRGFRVVLEQKAP